MKMMKTIPRVSVVFRSGYLTLAPLVLTLLTNVSTGTFSLPSPVKKAPVKL
jgi:hypothetical protein